MRDGAARHGAEERQSAAEGSQRLEFDVFVPGFARGSAVDLQPDDSPPGDRLIGFGVVDGLQIVEPELDAWALTADDVPVPIVAFENLGDGGLVGPGQNLVAARFVVERTQ